MFPSFSEENFPKNLHLAETLESFAKEKGRKVGQLAISWVLAKSREDGMPAIVPIPGTTSVARLEENMMVASLSPDELKQIDDILASMEVMGGRYPAGLAHLQFA
jgi:pyridoxine 4-dehydrogenase